MAARAHGLGSFFLQPPLARPNPRSFDYEPDTLLPEVVSKDEDDAGAAFDPADLGEDMTPAAARAALRAGATLRAARLALRLGDVPLLQDALLATAPADAVMRGLTRRLFNEKEVTSTLVMDALAAGLAAVGGETAALARVPVEAVAEAAVLAAGGE